VAAARRRGGSTGVIKYLALRLGLPLAGRFPRLFYGLAFIAGGAAWRLRPSLRRRVIANLAPACDGDRSRTSTEGLKVLRNVARYYVDLASLPHRDMAHYERDHITLVNGERLAIIRQPGPIIVVSAHMGDPELAVRALSYRGRPFVALVEPLHPRAVARYLLRLRSAAGGSFHEADFGGLRACVDALRAGGLLAILADRDLQGSGVCVQMCGRQVKLPRGPWELARRTGATVLPIFCARRGIDHLTVFVEEAFSVDGALEAEDAVRAATERFATLLERHIRREPGQWIVLEDFWRVHRCAES
jgi:KDO2-lipid IV(A) lauroyltransferase